MADLLVRETFPVITSQEDQFILFTQAMDKALADLQAQKDNWVRTSIAERVAIIDQLIHDFAAVTPRLIEAELQAKGLQDSDPGHIVESVNVYTVFRILHNLKRALLDIQATGQPRIPGKVYARSNGQTVAQVFPETSIDQFLFRGVTMEVWMEPGIQPVDLPGTQAVAYHEKNRPGKVALVLGAGNISALSFSDVLYKLFVEQRVVLLKMNPVNAYGGPIFEEGFRALVEKGFLRLAYGGAEQGNYLCQHPDVDEIHMTGSDKTFDAIVFGPGPDGARRKADRSPCITKPMTGELGCITPVIIVPGPWTPAEMDYQAEKIATWLTNNSGFACNAPHLILTHAEWPLRQSFLAALRQKMALLPLERAYYPGTKALYQRFIDAHPEAEPFGIAQEGQLPWTLIASVSNEAPNDILFRNEPFCGLLAETPIHAAGLPEFLERAVDFANRQVWGTLSAALFVHPKTLKMPGGDAAVERAIEALRYGAVCVNIQTPMAYVVGVAPWGGFPGQPLEDIQSGTGWVHNTLMFSRPQKVVVRGPFMETPKSPFIFSRAKTGRKVAELLLEMGMAPSLRKFLRIFMTAMRA